MSLPEESSLPRAPKTLAAIVFTDVVGFSRHSSVDERRAVANFERDLRLIRELCDRHAGVILKTLGDGVLMRFHSADNALSCALSIQRVLFEQSQRLDSRDVLIHRIGVHLGDILVSGTDVFGDGVNVAARLQAAARPGGIMMSRTVHDVVKGKVPFQANYLGPRQLKGIRDPVTVWEVPPIAQQLLSRQQAALEGMLPEGASAPVSAGGFRGLPAILMVIGSLVLVGVATAVVLKAVANAKDQGDKAWAQRVAHSKALHPKPGKETVTRDPKAGSGVEPGADPAVRAALGALYDKNDFSGMADYLSSHFGKDAAAAGLGQRVDGLVQFMGWLREELADTNADNPILINEDPEMGGPTRYYVDGAGHLVRQTATAAAFIQMGDLSKATLAALGAAARERSSGARDLSSNAFGNAIKALQSPGGPFDASDAPGSDSDASKNDAPPNKAAGT
jgi:class 3 adenylate cyclase